MALPWKKEVKEVVTETPKKVEQPTKAPEFVVPQKIEKTVESTGSSENSPEQSVSGSGEKISEAVPSAATLSPVQIKPVIKDEVVQQIENILSEDLTDMFLKMSPQQQEEFRAKGEETASKIRVLMSSAKVNVKKILLLITDWLKMIPGVNKFFLEQEAKIKTDKILLNTEDFRSEGKL